MAAANMIMDPWQMLKEWRQSFSIFAASSLLEGASQVAQW